MHASSKLLESYARLVAEKSLGVSGYPPIMQQCMVLDHVAGILADNAKPEDRVSIWAALRATKCALLDVGP